MASAPAARTAASLTYQPLARLFLLFGGDTFPNGGLLSGAETWLWNGQSWTKHSGPGPSARAVAAMDYDVAHGKAVLYGGQYDEAGKSRIDLFDTWLWDGAQWVVSSVQSAPKLIAPKSVYDAARANLVLIGIGSSGLETWIWSGSEWSKANPVHSPFARSGEGLAYVASSKQVVLFGGYASGLGYLDDTWLWDGSDWRNVQPTPAPTARLSPTFISGQQAILFGGSAGLPSPPDTWRWDGSRWAQLNAMHAPPARRAAAGASDGQYLVVVGGDAAGVLTDGWRWDGTDWKQC
jgi:hypothetical protein